MLIRPAISSMLQCFARVLFFVFLGSLCLHMNAQSSGKIIPKVTIASRSITISEVFKLIRKQTGKVIWYRNEDINENKKVTVNFKDASLEDVLRYLFQASDISWTYDDEAIILKKKLNDNTSRSSISADTTLSPIQLMTVTGKVTDEKGSPIIGATVVLKGTKIGTISDSNGNFLLNDVPGNAVLTISNISFITRDIAVKNRSALEPVTLNKYEKVLDDVVILAYSKTTNRLLTGNVSSVKAKDIQNSPVNNPILAVAGRVPGVTINQSSGFAGSGVDIVIQGLNSLERGSAPFYVVDGVPYAQTLLPNLGNILGASGRGAGDGPVTGNPLTYLNPADIESIEILKDADATAIYGSRAANGAIIITTKRGKAGKMKVDATLQTGFGQVTQRLDLLNTQQYLSIRREAKRNSNLPISAFDYDLNGSWDTTKNTDWQKELIGNHAQYTDVQLSLTGGTNNIQYLAGGGFHKETTVFPTNLADTKISFRFNMDAKSNNNKLRYNLSTAYLIDDNKLPNADITISAIILAPNAPNLLNEDGTINWAKNNEGRSTLTSNPYAALKSLYLNKTKNLIANSTLSYEIINGLNIKANMGYTNLQTDETTTNPLNTLPPEYRNFFPRSSNFGFNNISSWILEPQITYETTFKHGNLDVLIGSTIQQNENSRKQINATGFPSDLVLEDISAATNIISPPNSSILSKYKYNAAFFRVNYNWEGKYILNISGRRDGSSRFGRDNQFHNFGALGAAWIFSEEKIIRDKVIFLSFGKLKASYGTTGNDQIGDYTFLSLYQNNNDAVPYRGGSSLALNRISNPYLQWEETRKFSIGVDLGFVKDRILISSNYYRNRSSNMLVSAPLPSTAGPGGGLIANLPAKIQNTGWELTFNSTNYKSHLWSWTTNINLTIPSNKVLEFKGLENSIYSQTYVIGEPVNLIKTFRSNGVNPQTGKYEFLDKDGKITNNPNSDLDNFNKILNPSPAYYGGFSNTISYKGITLDFLFQFVKQIGRNAIFSSPGQAAVNQTKLVLDRWQKAGDIKPVQQLTIYDPTLLNAYSNQLKSDAYYEDASFVRLKNVTLSYIFSQALLKRIGVTNLRLFLTAQNLFTITPFNGLDPESKSNLTLPPLRVITFGVNVSL